MIVRGKDLVLDSGLTRKSAALAAQITPNTLLLVPPGKQPTALMLLASVFALLVSAQASVAANVYLIPPGKSSAAPLSPTDASFTLARHFGLEHLEPEGVTTSFGDEIFVGQGLKNGLLIALQEEDAHAVLPSSIAPSFRISLPAPTSDLYPLISTYIHRARHSYTSVHSAFDQKLRLSAPATDAATVEEMARSVTTFFEGAEEPAFAAMELASLASVRSEFGVESHEYGTAARAVRALISEAVAETNRVNSAFIVYAPPSYVKRELDPRQTQSPLPHHPIPQQPIGSVSTCFTSVEACTNGTSSCSGRGNCAKASKPGRTCFVCSCEVTKSGEGAQTKTQVWAGERCERKDVSSPFVLLAGTVVGIILLIAGSIGLLYGVGSQELPSTLMGGAVNAKRD
ncbi:hypothetical protein HGRIS_002996 [Hohenbuehelia grisea]|uniref:Vacuolar sorting protein Vps3844 C-terminal domain-containing protein n=1 Tax=Hohenbuehelia grisea TaxID=104357 RepID=A0ABR3JNL3_9AGAR